MRAITRVRYGTPGQGLISSNVSYTPRGSIATSAAPYYWPSDPAYNQTTAYDDLDRPISITEADGAVTTISYGLSSEPTGFHMVTTTDPTGRVTVVHSDARGNVIRKDQLLNGTPLTTRYSYDVLGRLTGIVDPIGASWSYVYDTLSRRIVSYDPDLGTWIYQYDYSGNLIGQRDALGQATQNTYDALDRIITSVTRAGTGQADTTNYLYDQARAGTANYGHLTTTSNAALTIQHDYDIAGREFRTSYLTPGGSLSASVTSTFDVGGRVIGLSYGDGDQIGSPSQPWTYDLYARLYTMPGAITAQTYIAAGATASITYANGAATQFAYSPLRLWLTGLTTTSGGSTLQQLAYGRDASGRITQIQATGGPSDDGWTYAYDGVGPPTLELSPHHERGVGSLSLAPSC